MAIPLAKSPCGRFYGNRGAHVQIELFLDVQCPYSAKAWPVVEQVLAHYGPQAIGLRLHMMVLSNHRQSWDVTLGLVGLAGDNDERFFKFLGFLYQRQASFFNAAFAQRTHEDLKALVAELGESFDGTGRNHMAAWLGSDAVFAQAKLSGRYAALRGVWSTPTVFVNDSERSEIGSASTLADWRALIDPLLH